MKLFHWSPYKFNQLRTNYQGIHLASNLQTSLDLTINRKKDFDSGYVYEVVPMDNLNPAHFNIDTMDWGLWDIMNLLLGKLGLSNIEGATAGIKDDGTNWDEHASSDVVTIPVERILPLKDWLVKFIDEAWRIKKHGSDYEKNHSFEFIVDLIHELGYDCISYSNYGENPSGDICYILFSPNQIKSFKYIGRGSEVRKLIKESYKLTEATRQQLAIQSRSVGQYKDQSFGKNRYERRNKSRIATSVKQYNKIDMNQLFKQDRLEVAIPVIGETDNYEVTVRIDGVIAEMAKNIKNNKYKLEFRTVLQSLTKVFNTKDVYINCTCLDKNTKIKLLDGTAPTVSEMKSRFDAGEQLYVYSVNENGDFVPGIVEGVYVTGRRDHFIEITLDNGEKIRTTPDHPYLLRNGHYIEAQQLQIGQSLMPLYFDKTDTGYETVKFNSTGKYHSTYKVVGNTFYPQEIINKQKDALADGSNEKMHYDVAIHHKDFNKNNNSPENLQIMTAYEHWMYHANNIDRLWSNQDWANKTKERSRAWMTWLNEHPTERMIESRHSSKGKWICNNDSEWKDWHDKLVSQQMIDYWATMSEEEKEYRLELISQRCKEAWVAGKYDTEKFHEARQREIKKLHTPEMKAKAVEGIRTYWLNMTEEEKVERLEKAVGLQKGRGWNKGKHLSEEDKLHKSLAALNKSPEEKAAHAIKIRDAKYIKVFKKMIEDNVELTEENYELYRTNYFNKSPRLRTHFNSIAEATSYFKLNHKIIDIKEIYCDADDVYDIKVKDYHNFLVNAGVILHNCPDHCFNFSHWNIMHNCSTLDTAHDPGAGKGIANPNDDKGRGCKHSLLILSNGDWMMKVASVINNYIHYMSEKMQKPFLKLIFPKLYGCDADEMARLDILGKEEVEETLESNSSFIDAINEYGKNRGKIKKGSNRNTASTIQYEPEENTYDNDNQKNLEKAEKETAEANEKARKEAEEREAELEAERQAKIEAAAKEDETEYEEEE